MWWAVAACQPLVPATLRIVFVSKNRQSAKSAQDSSAFTMQNLPIFGHDASSAPGTGEFLQMLRIDRVSIVCENPASLESIQGHADTALSAPQNRGLQIGKGVPLP